MSRLRVPFKKQNTNVIESPVKESPVEEFVDPPTILVEKGKEKQVERLWGIENFGNTCYCNSVLQALYACEPFREFIASYPDVPRPVSALAPAPSEQSKPKSSPAPTSPLATKSGNPFDNPQLNGVASPTDKKRGLFGRRPTSSQSALPVVTIKEPTTPVVPILTSPLDVPPVTPNPNGPPPSVFETIQTLFHHLSSSLPHQPLPARKDAKADAENAQTASLLPTEAPASPTPNTPNGPPAPPPGPPLLASLPPPSAPRGGGPFQAGTLGRGVVRPEDLLKTVKRENEMFRGMSQQDAHEFLGWVLNKVAEDVEVVDRSLREVGKEVSKVRGHGKTFVQNLFEGILTNETRCLSCETTSSRDEQFLDLSIDIEQHSSVTACLRQFSASEMLCQKNKFFCDSCCGLQEAEKRMKIKRLPHVLALHLKRFKYQESLGRYTKLFYRVPFPTQLRLPNTSDETENPDRLYELFAVVVHIGNGPHHGHYVCLIRSGGRWVMCDDENIEPIDDADIFRYFGDYPSGAGYVLFYQAADLDLPSLGLATKEPPITKQEKEGLVNISESPDEAPPIPNVTSVPSQGRDAGSSDRASPTDAVASTQNAVPSVLAPPIASPVFHASSPPVAFIQPRRNTTSSMSSTPTTPVGPTPSVPAAMPTTPATPNVQLGSDANPVQANGALKTPTGSTQPSVQMDGLQADKSKLQTTPQSKYTLAPVASLPQPGSTVSSTQTTSPVTPTSTVVSNGKPQDDKWNQRKPIAKEPDLSSSMVSETSSHSSASQLGSIGRKPSQRDRNVSSSSQASGQDKYTGGGGLGRRLSGMSMGRSGSLSFGKFGFGKKDKNKVDE